MDQKIIIVVLLNVVHWRCFSCSPIVNCNVAAADTLSSVRSSLVAILQEIDVAGGTDDITAAPGLSSGDVGTTYKRWGRTSCPQTAELVYSGHMAKSFYSHPGGGADYLCLVRDPEWHPNVLGGFQNDGKLHGVEYKADVNRLFDSELLNHDVPCAVCDVSGRSRYLMIPGRRSCYDGWTKEYSGFIMTEPISGTKGTHVCVDESAEADNGGAPAAGGGKLQASEARCGYALPCPPYVDGNEISCVVCTK